MPTQPAAPPPPPLALVRYLIAVSLAEAESIRRLIHSLQMENDEGGAPAPSLGLAIRVLESGMLIDQSAHFEADADTAEGEEVGVECMLQCLRFYNNDMWYDDNELKVRHLAYLYPFVWLTVAVPCCFVAVVAAVGGGACIVCFV